MIHDIHFIIYQWISLDFVGDMPVTVLCLLLKSMFTNPHSLNKTFPRLRTPKTGPTLPVISGK